MKKLLALLLLLASPAWAQFATTTTTAPVGDSSTRIADTAFVQQSITIGSTLCQNILGYGGSGNNSTDNTTPFTNALAALTGNGGCIFFPPGKYKFNSQPTFTYPATTVFSVSIIGGGSDNTILTWPNAAGGLSFTCNNSSNNSLHMENLSLTTGQAAGGTAVSFGCTTTNSFPAFSAITDFYRVTIRGEPGYATNTDYWTTGILTNNINNVNLEGVYIAGSVLSGTGAFFQSTATSAAVVFNVAKSSFNQLANGLVYGTNTQGITCDQCNFTGMNAGIINAGGASALAQLSVTNSQFGCGTNACNGIISSVVIPLVTLSNNLFITSSTNDTGVALTPGEMTTITGNNFWGINSSASQFGLILGNTTSQPCTISGNSFSGFNGTGSFGLVLQAASANCNITGNSFFNNTTNVSDAGTGNSYWNNVGFDPAWAVFTPTNTCGTATFSPVSSSRKTVGKQTWVRNDFTISVIGTCNNSLTFTLPNTANSTATLMGGEYAVNNELLKCLLNAASATATCTKRAGAAFAVNEHWIVSGVYENQ